MTQQAHDVCLFEGARYDVCAHEGRGRVRPSDFGIAAESTTTADRRGYWTLYAVDGGSLRLRELHVGSRLAPEAAPRIGERRAAGEGGRLVYRSLDLPVAFSGGLLLGSGASRAGSWFMRPPWDYARLWELRFEEGRLVGVWDRSAKAEEIHRTASPDDLQSLYSEEACRRLFQGFSTTYLLMKDDLW